MKEYIDFSEKSLKDIKKIIEMIDNNEELDPIYVLVAIGNYYNLVSTLIENETDGDLRCLILSEKSDQKEIVKLFRGERNQEQDNLSLKEKDYDTFLRNWDTTGKKFN